MRESSRRSAGELGLLGETGFTRVPLAGDGERPDFRITVRPLLFGWRAGDKLVHAGDIEVATCGTGARVQVLPITAWQPIDFAATFEARDINFDGLMDFSVLSEFAAKWGSRWYWVYDPESRKFVTNELTRKLGENCLAGEASGCWRAYSIDFDPSKHEIEAHYLIGAGPGGPPVSRFRVENNDLIAVHKELIGLGPGGCTVTRVGGEMHVTRVRRFDAKGVPVDPLRRRKF